MESWNTSAECGLLGKGLQPKGSWLLPHERISRLPRPERAPVEVIQPPCNEDAVCCMRYPTPVPLPSCCSRQTLASAGSWYETGVAHRERYAGVASVRNAAPRMSSPSIGLIPRPRDWASRSGVWLAGQPAATPEMAAQRLFGTPTVRVFTVVPGQQSDTCWAWPLTRYGRPRSSTPKRRAAAASMRRVRHCRGDAHACDGAAGWRRVTASAAAARPDQPERASYTRSCPYTPRLLGCRQT